MARDLVPAVQDTLHELGAMHCAAVRVFVDIGVVVKFDPAPRCGTFLSRLVRVIFRCVAHNVKRAARAVLLQAFQKRERQRLSVLRGVRGRRQGPSSKVMGADSLRRRTCSMRRTGLKYTGVRGAEARPIAVLEFFGKADGLRDSRHGAPP